ncbi:hypothetical protein O181_018585 [Austropuccinia psidii MF-1]|uniref:Uncharacterized protein n=1 Tax=Austropuccinia psidii MF-1 TaxID=1389203 RepID=A0A9Q3GU70_9BASI|nr:hypothetical protein [Austropuccinia psidii MF-1]
MQRHPVVATVAREVEICLLCTNRTWHSSFLAVASNIPAPSTLSRNPPSKDGNKPSNSEDLVALVHSLTQRVYSSTSAQARDLAKLQSYCSHRPPSSTPSQPHFSAYNKFLQAPHHLAYDGPTLLPNGSNYQRWLEAVNTTLCYVFDFNTPFHHSPALLAGWPHSKNQAIPPP